MPIRPENRALYPKDWSEISDYIRFHRAKGRCECTGQCGTGHVGRCYGRHNQAHPVTFAMVVLTTMHLDHDPTNNVEENLLAGCQRCHNAYDAEHRREGIKRRAREEMEASGQGQLFAPLPEQPTGPESEGYTKEDGTAEKFVLFKMSESGKLFIDTLHAMAEVALLRGEERFSVLTAMGVARGKTKLRANNSFAPWIADELCERDPRLLDIIQRKTRRKAAP